MKNTYGKRNSSLLNNSYTKQKEMITYLKKKLKNYKLRLSVTDDFEAIHEQNKSGIMIDTNKEKEEDKLGLLTQKKEMMKLVGNVVANNGLKSTPIVDETVCLISEREFVKYSNNKESLKKKEITDNIENTENEEILSNQKNLENHEILENCEILDNSKIVSDDEFTDLKTEELGNITIKKYENPTNIFTKIANIQNQEFQIDSMRNSFSIPGLSMVSNETSLYDDIYNTDESIFKSKKMTIHEKSGKKHKELQDNNETFHLSDYKLYNNNEINHLKNIDSDSNNSFSNEDLTYYDYKSDISFDYMPNKTHQKIKLDCVPNNSFFEEKLQLETKHFKTLACKQIKKINEATFSDVYMLDNKIFKIVSFNEMTEAEFYKETFINKILSDEKGVIKLVDCFFVNGCYPRHFLKAWLEFENKYNNRPKNGIHKHGVLVMEFGGVDLESFKFNDEREVEYFLYELLFILENLEDKYEFEHRDLHWGNILLLRNESKKKKIIANIENTELCNKQELNTENKQLNIEPVKNIKKKSRKDTIQKQIRNLMKYENNKKEDYKKKLSKTENKNNSNIDIVDSIVIPASIRVKKNCILDSNTEEEEQSITRESSYDTNKKRKREHEIKIDSLIGENEEVNASIYNYADGMNTHNNESYRPFEINIIDFTLSRLKYKNKIIFTDLAKKNWLFEGNEEEDLQYGVYKKIMRDEYVSFDEKSNFIWYEYIVKKVKSKCLEYKILDMFLKHIDNCNCIKELADEIRLIQEN